jgi:flagellar assembly protein FliH
MAPPNEKALRRPQFMGELDEESGAAPVSFASLPDPSVLRLRLARTGERRTAPAPAPTPPPPPVVAQPTPNPRLEAAIEALRLRSERLAEQARSDALEVGFMVARRILELELSQSPAPLFALIRSAIRRAGESRKVVVRLCPADQVKIEAARKGQADGALSLLNVDLVPDPSLSPGDCVVEADLGTVDGRLTTRLAELARALEPSAEGEVA